MKLFSREEWNALYPPKDENRESAVSPAPEDTVPELYRLQAMDYGDDESAEPVQDTRTDDRRYNAALIRLAVCGLVIVTAACLKLAFPREVESFLQAHAGFGIDLSEGAAFLGEGLRDAFAPQKPSNSLLESVPPAEPSGPSEEPSAPPSPAPSAEAESGTDAPSEAPPPPDPALTAGEKNLLVGETIKVEEFLMEAAAPVIAMDDSGFVEDPEEDDTANVPFGYEVPSNADFRVHTLSFEYAAPLKGDFSSVFGYRMHPIDQVTKFHYGVDIPAAKNTPVKSFAEGTVRSAGEINSYGKYVTVQHPDGYITLYAHLNSISVKKGQKVKLGTTLGKVGMTGKATGYHLHFELRNNGKLIDPMPYLT